MERIVEEFERHKGWRITVHQCLGQGAAGTVYDVENKHGQRMAMKRCGVGLQGRSRAAGRPPRTISPARQMCCPLACRTGQPISRHDCARPPRRMMQSDELVEIGMDPQTEVQRAQRLKAAQVPLIVVRHICSM